MNAIHTGTNFSQGNKQFQVLEVRVLKSPTVSRDSLLTQVEYFDKETGEIHVSSARDLIEPKAKGHVHKDNLIRKYQQYSKAA